MASEIPNIGGKPSGLAQITEAGHSPSILTGARHDYEVGQKLLLPGQTFEAITDTARYEDKPVNVPKGGILKTTLDTLEEIILCHGVSLPVVGREGRCYLQIPATKIGEAGGEVEWKPGELLFIGRNAVPNRADKTIVIPNPGVSREQAVLYRSDNGDVFVEDLNSANGTRLRPRSQFINPHDAHEPLVTPQPPETPPSLRPDTIDYNREQRFTEYYDSQTNYNVDFIMEQIDRTKKEIPIIPDGWLPFSSGTPMRKLRLLSPHIDPEKRWLHGGGCSD